MQSLLLKKHLTNKQVSIIEDRDQSLGVDLNAIVNSDVVMLNKLRESLPETLESRPLTGIEEVTVYAHVYMFLRHRNTPREPKTGIKATKEGLQSQGLIFMAE